MCLLRGAEVLLGQGLTVPKSCRQLGFSEHTYYRWRRTYGGMDVDKARRLKERENARLKRLVGEQTLYIEPGSPWENRYIELFNGKLRDELLNGELFMSLREARVVIEAWRREYNQVRSHSSLAYRPPAPEVVMPRPSAAALCL